MKEKYVILILLINLFFLPLSSILFSLPFYVIVFMFTGFFLIFRFPKLSIIILPILFLLTLHINNFFSFSLKNFYFDFNWEKLVISNPNNLRLIDRYRNENLFLPFKIRNLFYSPWLLTLNWVDLIFKLISFTFLSNIMGYSGLILLLLGLINYFEKNKKNWSPFIWMLTVVSASGLGILVDSKKALILAFPAIIYFLFYGIKSKYFNFLWKYWLSFLVIDLLLK